MKNYYHREIAEVPENVSDAGSLGGEGPTVDPIVPTLGLGTVCNIRVTAIYSYRPTTQQHLTFDKDEVLTVSEQQVIFYSHPVPSIPYFFTYSHL